MSKICGNCFYYHFLFGYCGKERCKVGGRSTCDEFIEKGKVDGFKKDYKMGRCNPCPYAEEMNANGDWLFLGCFHKPYNGKWVAEIKDCPKERRRHE